MKTQKKVDFSSILDLFDEAGPATPALPLPPSAAALHSPASPSRTAPQRTPDAGERAQGWLDAISNLPLACGYEGVSLARLTEAFIWSPWPYAAMAAGWSDSELFSLDTGLIPAMARQTLHILAFDDDAGIARLINGHGELVEFARAPTADQPWWRDARVIASYGRIDGTTASED